MAGVAFLGKTDEVALSAATVKTVAQIVAAASHRVHLTHLCVSFDGTSGAAAAVEVELIRQSDAGTASALTLQKQNSGDNETLQTTAIHTATVEPATTAILYHVDVHPQGFYDFPWINEQNPFTIIGGERLGIACTAPATVNVSVSFKGYE